MNPAIMQRSCMRHTSSHSNTITRLCHNATRIQQRYTTPSILCQQPPLTRPIIARQCFHNTTYVRSSHGPMTHGDIPKRKKTTINSIRKMYERKEPISMITAHDFPSGLVADQAGIDIVLVGDSLAMVGLGMTVCYTFSLLTLSCYSQWLLWFL